MPKASSSCFGFVLLWLALTLSSLSFLSASTIIPVPYYEAIVGMSKNTITKSITLNGSAKYQVNSEDEYKDGLSILQIKQSQSSASAFCSVKDRKLLLSSVATTPLQNPVSQSDLSSLVDSQAPPIIVISWGQLSAKASLNYANFMSLDSKLQLSLFKVDPMAQTADSIVKVESVDLSSLTFEDNLINGDIFLAQIGSKIFIAHSKPTELLLSQIFSTGTALSGEILNIPEIPKNLGLLTDFIGFSISDAEEGILFLLFQGGLVGVHIKSDGASKILKIQPIIAENPHDFLNIRINYISDSTFPLNLLQIYILCQNKGLYRYNLHLSALKDISAILEYDTKFFINIPYGRVFNHYRGRIFFIHTSADTNQTYEYEVLLTDSSLYYLNRIHNTNHLVKDIIVDNYFIILSGSNTQTVSWHSVHPSIMADITSIQQVNSIHGFIGGSVLSFSNITSNQSQSYFIGFQSHHLFIYKAIHIRPYLLCEPKYSSDHSTVVGQHRLILTLVQQRFQNKNSFQAEERKQAWILKVTQVYGDQKIANMMIGGVITVVVVFILGMGVIYCKIKKQDKIQYQLFQEIDMLKHTEKNVGQIKGEEGEIIEVKDWKRSNSSEGEDGEEEDNQVQERQKIEDEQQFSFRKIRKSNENNSQQDGGVDKDNLVNPDEFKAISINNTPDQQDKLLPGDTLLSQKYRNKTKGKKDIFDINKEK